MQEKAVINQLPIIGWQEWCALPSLGIPAIKAKVDTGAQTSALHAYRIETYRQNRNYYAKFYAHPIQRNDNVQIACCAKIVDERTIKSSNGQKEQRYVIESDCQLGGVKFPILITLTNRDIMKFRMLLGRNAIKGKALVNPAKICCLSKIDAKQLAVLY
jgi:hypothetical protein